MLLSVNTTKNLPVKELVFGVNRPQSWWDEHPEQQGIFEGRGGGKMEGERNPGFALNLRSFCAHFALIFMICAHFALTLRSES